MAFRCGAWGAAGWSAIGRDCQGSAPLLGFLAGARWVVDHCVRSMGSRRERARPKLKKKASFPSSPLHVRGEEERGTVSFKTTPFCSSPFFFNIYETALFWRKRAVSFKYGARMRQCSHQPSIIFFVFNCIPAEFEPRPYIWPRFSLWSLASDSFN